MAQAATFDSECVWVFSYTGRHGQYRVIRAKGPVSQWLGSAAIERLEVFMCIFNRVPKNLIAATLIVMTALCWGVSQSLAQTQPISILIVRHAEADGSQPTIPLTAAGRQRADLLAYTLR